MEVEIDGEYEVTCPRCDGTGKISDLYYLNSDGEYEIMDTKEVHCYLCKGTGEILQYVTGTTEVDPCECRHEGYL